MAKNADDIVPFKATHPGDILKVELEARNIKRRDFARTTDILPSHLNQLIKGKRDISMKIALKLERALGVPSDFWIRLQNLYNRICNQIGKRKRGLSHGIR